MANNIPPFDINSRLVLAVGMVAIQWARVEFTAQKIVVGLLKSDGPTGLMLASNLGNRSITDFLNAFASVVNDEGFKPGFAEDLSILTSEFNRLLGIRNRTVHNTWPVNVSDDEAMALVVRFKGSAKLHEEIWEIGAIEDTIDEIVDYLDALTRFSILHGLNEPMEAWEKHATSHGTPAPQATPVFQNRGPKTKEALNRIRSSQL